MCGMSTQQLWLADVGRIQNVGYAFEHRANSPHDDGCAISAGCSINAVAASASGSRLVKALGHSR